MGNIKCIKLSEDKNVIQAFASSKLQLLGLVKKTATNENS